MTVEVTLSDDHLVLHGGTFTYGTLRIEGVPIFEVLVNVHPTDEEETKRTVLRAFGHKLNRVLDDA